MSKARPLPFRQVHLDFHTSPLIPDVGADFDAQEFILTLQQAHVNSVTVFAKCHHGYSYYPTKVGTPHPHLTRDLLGEMIEACHGAAIRAPVYITVVWDELAFAEHPEWRQVTPEGCIAGPSDSPLKPGWKNLCINTPYAEYVLAQVEEVLAAYEPDGVFLDIVTRATRFGGCVCPTCVEDMLAGGLDPGDAEQRSAFSLEVERRFMSRAHELVTGRQRTGRKPALSLFFNSRLRMDLDPTKGLRPEGKYFSHYEIESLPGHPQWGYDHFPMFVRYFQTLGKELVGMTGRFHTSWGDFGGLRNRAALEFECLGALAHGATCSIGDQLHPRGQLNTAAYERIGEVYGQVEAVERWCAGTTALPEIGVFTTNTAVEGQQSLVHATDQGALHVLEQLKHQFQFVDRGADLSPYAVVILPDGTHIDEDLGGRLRRFLADGGKLLIAGKSGLDQAQGEFVLSEEMGVQYQGPAEFSPDYVVVEPALGESVEPMPHVCQLPGVRVAPAPGTQILARAGAPYFNRTWQHFCSHQYTPMEKVTDDPIVTQNKGVVYVARPLFREYAESSRRVHRQILANCLRRLLPRPRLGKHNLPSTATVTVRRLGDHLVVHLLHYVHQRRGVLDIVEETHPLVDVELSVRSEQRPSAVRLVPQQEPLQWEYLDGYIRFGVPRMCGHQMILLVGAAG
jgi:hypothetical protein